MYIYMRKTRGRKKMLILTGRRPTRKNNVGGRKHNRNSSGGAESIVPTFLHMLNTVKLYHWKTTSFATHKATDELYSSLNSKIDEFVEVMLGKDELGGRSNLLNVHMIKLDGFSNNASFKKEIEVYKTFLLNMSEDPVFSALMHADLLAIRDEILADLNKFLYLLSLD
jgi:hypothetical protein